MARQVSRAGTTSPSVYEQLLCSGRSSRSCLNTNNNDKVKGKNTVYHLSLMRLFFLQHTLIFEDFRAVKIMSSTFSNMHFHEIPAFNTVQRHTQECLLTHRHWKNQNHLKTSFQNIPKLSRAPGQLQGLCCHCFSKEEADCWL